MAPRYVRLSGELADQAILNNLGACVSRTPTSHMRSPRPRPGVAFDVRDGKAGFPAAIVGRTGTPVEMRVVDGSLRIRSNRVALGYLGEGGALADADGFVDTGDMVELRGDRYYFVGRREGVINVGGQKVHPEEVEAVINQHPAVQIARVRGRRSPITGAIVVADIVIHAIGRLRNDRRRDASDLPAQSAPAQGPGDAPAGRSARHRRLRQAGALQCVTSSSRAAAAVSGLASRRRWPSSGFR